MKELEDAIARVRAILDGTRDYSNLPVGLSYEYDLRLILSAAEGILAAKAQTVSCAECAFTYDAAHSFEDGHYECPLCERKKKCEGEWSPHICPDCYDTVRFNREVVEAAPAREEALQRAEERAEKLADALRKIVRHECYCDEEDDGCCDGAGKREIAKEALAADPPQGGGHDGC